jgi:hypothetical protein
MCFFMTIATSEPAERVREHCSRGLRAIEYENPGVPRSLDRPMHLLTIVTDVDCSCALYRAVGEAGQLSRIEKLCRKYERLGWSRTKIERVLVSARAAAERSQGPGWTGFRPELRDLLARLANELGEIAVLVHSYTGGIENEFVQSDLGGGSGLLISPLSTRRKTSG